MKKFIFFVPALLWCLAVVGAAAAVDFEVREGTVFYNGSKVEGSSVAGEPSVIDPSGRVLLWAAVDENEAPGFKGAPTGLYFFWGHAESDSDGVMQNADGRFAAYLPLDNPDQADLGFSADGRWFFVSLGTAPQRDLTVYEFDGLKQVKRFTVMSPVLWTPKWDGRLAFTWLDEAKGERSPDLGMQAPGWMSVMVYDPKTDALTPAIEATATADYMLDGFDEATRQLDVTEYVVKSPADWAKEDAAEIKPIKVDFPPLG